MCWKKIKNNFLDFTSIRTRLTILYSISAFIVFLALTLFLYWWTISLLQKADYEFLDDQMDVIHYILRSKSYDFKALKEAVIDSPADPSGSIYRYYIRLIDNKGVVIETKGMDELIPYNPKLFVVPIKDTKKRHWWYVKNDRHYLLMRAPISLGANRHYGWIQIALDTSYQHTVIHDREKLTLIVLIGALSSVLLGLFMSHRGIISLYKLTSMVRNVSIGSLENRVEIKNWPKELKALGLAFNQMLDRIEHSFSQLKQFSSDLAHELRTPINNMIGEAEINLSHATTIEDHQAGLQSMLEELQRTAHIIENMLFLARAENPQFELTKSTINVEEEVSLVCDYFQAMADDKDIILRYEGNAKFQANTIMIRRLFSNLLSNALNHTRKGGDIVFQIQMINNSIVKIILTDNGNGIGSAHLPYLFDRFYRADSSREYTGGTGLGLAIARSIVQLHQGDIHIDSRLGVGTTVTLTFPT